MNHRPRKRFGQNFLHDPAIIARIVNAIGPKPGERLVEIGPGQGAITWPLLERAGSLEVVELDRDLVAALQQQTPAGAHLSIHSADALRFDFRALARPGERLRVVGNLPYNISTPLLFHLLEQSEVIEDMFFLLQKEVVDRITATPGNKSWGRLGVMVQYHCAAQRLFGVGPGAFYPPPKVDSAVLHLAPYRTPPVDVGDYRVFSQLVAQAFTLRRKTLRNAARNFLTADAMADLGIDPQRRAETLSLEEFARLSRAAEIKMGEPPSSP